MSEPNDRPEQRLFSVTTDSAPLCSQLELPDLDPRFDGEMTRAARVSVVNRLAARERVVGGLQRKAVSVVGGTWRDRDDSDITHLDFVDLANLHAFGRGDRRVDPTEGDSVCRRIR